MATPNKKNPAMVARARALFDAGTDLNVIAAKLGIVRATAGDWLKTTGVTAAELYGRGRLGRHPQPPMPITRAVPDTRSLSGQLCGEPLPGRSALDMRERRT